MKSIYLLFLLGTNYILLCTFWLPDIKLQLTVKDNYLQWWTAVLVYYLSSGKGKGDLDIMIGYSVLLKGQLHAV
jgi:hypothetical protein